MIVRVCLSVNMKLGKSVNPNSDFLLVLLPFCSCPTVRQRRIVPLVLPKYLLGRTSGFFGPCISATAICTG